MTTNKKNTKKNSAARKLIPAVGMLTASAMMLASSTYAWFTMNKEVEVTGMELRTKVGANLLICSDNVEASYSEKDLLEGRMGLLEPVSSINGTTGSFYYTVNATGKGTKESGATIQQYQETQAVANTVAGKNKYDTTFNSVYGVKTSGTLFNQSDIAMTKATASSSGTDGAAYGYLDYVFYLKATADADTAVLNMTECNLLHGDGAVDSSGTVGEDIDRAWRVGVFVSNITANGGKGYDPVKTTDPAASGNTPIAILGLKDSKYFSEEASGGTAQAQKDDTATLGDVVNFMNSDSANGVTLDTISGAGTTAYYKVLVRVWLEGEDNTCNSRTYAALQDNSWKLNCKFDLQGTGAKGVKMLNSDATKVAQGETQVAGNNDDVVQ